MPETVKITAPAVYLAETYSVYLREHWEDEWEEVPFYCNWVSWSAAPTISSAEFERRYGEGITETENKFSYKDYLNRGTWWVKVEIDQFARNSTDEDHYDPAKLVWIGIIEVDGDNPAGSPYKVPDDADPDDPHDNQPMGAQKFLAYGPEILLERSIVSTTHAWRWGKAGQEETHYYEAIPFNEFMRIRAADSLAKKEFQDRPGNRSRVANADGVYPFADPREVDGEKSTAAWEAHHIVDYLLHYHSPKDKDGNKTIQFSLFSDEYLPSGVCHELPQHGRTVKEILDQLLDRRRLLSYVVEPQVDNEEKFVVRPFSFLDEKIDLDDLEIWENTEQKILLVDEAILVDGLHVQESWVQFYHRVVAVGAPIVCCGTFSYVSSLDRFWTDDEATAYATAATAQAGYGDLEPFVKQQFNDAVRKEERFERVYAAFGIKPIESGVIVCDDRFPGHDQNRLLPNDLLGDAEKCIPPIDPAETSIYFPSLRLAKVLPLRSDHDYRDEKIVNNAVADNTPKSVTWKYLSPLVILQLEDPFAAKADPEVGYFSDLGKSGELAHCEGMGYGAGVEFSAAVHVPENSPYFQLKISGAPQHVLGNSNSTLGYHPPVNLGYEEMKPLYNWTRRLLATLAVETQARVQVQWPENVSVETDFLRTLYLDLSDYAALHYVVPKTVVAVEFGKLVRTTSGGVIRDDRPLLKRMARLAYEWYAKRRQALSLTYTGAKRYFRVGDLIVEMGEVATREPIRSVVTQIRVDFGRNPTDVHRTTIETQWAELDVLRLLA